MPPAFLTRLRARWSSWTPERYPRLARGKHAALAFVICLVAFTTYRVTAVPLIEPAEEHRQQRASAQTDPNSSAVEEQRRRLAVYFKDGDWELDNAKVLETSQGMLILKDYKTLGDGRVELKPCTVLLLPEGHEELSDEEKARRAVVMRAPNGARLQFEEFNIRMAKVGKLIGGELNGEIVIHSQQREPGPEDDLLILTRDVVMADNAVHSDAPVEFRLGASHGSGREMWMDLIPDNSGNAKRGPSIGGIRGFSMKREVKLHLALESLKKKADGAPVAPSQEPEPPIEVSCRGPFKFDMETYIASFTDHVDVLRIAPSGPSDQLLCEELYVHFAPKANADGTTDPAKPGRLPKLEPGWIRALGNPVVITAPSSKATAFGEELAYDLRKRNGALKALRKGEQVKVTHEQDEIHARELHFSPGANQGDLGSFLAVGPGWLKGARPEEPNAPIEARWSNQALLRPVEGEHVLSVTGRAFVKAEGSGSLAADAIHAWLRPGETLPDGKKSQPTPRRVHAIGAVEFSAAQIDGHVQKLDAYFENPANAAPATLEMQSDVAAPIQQSVYLQTAQQPQTTAPTLAPYPQTATSNNVVGLPTGGVANKPAAQRFDVKGGHLRLLVLLEKPQSRLADLVIEENVEIVEIPLARPNDQPLVLRGDRVDLKQPAPQQAEVKIFGQPAHVEARGMTLDSAQINLDQADNRMWTSGAGQMNVLVDRDLDGKELAAKKPLKVTWRGDMEFDGLEARFNEGVEASQDQQELHTKQLAVVMRQRVDFQQGMKGESLDTPQDSSAQVALLRCKGGVDLHQFTYDGPTLIAFREMRTRDLMIDQQTGELTAHGPGMVESAQYGSSNPLMDASPPAATPASPPAMPFGEAKPEQINYLRVDFAEIIKGNLKSKEMTFHESVRAIYGPVPDWRTRLNPQHPDFTNENCFLLTTDALTVRQAIAQTDNRNTVELEADGDTRVEGQKFNAWASRLTYDQAKDLITLHGDAYTDAEITHVGRVGELAKRTQAGTIYYSKKNQTVTVGDFKHLDLSGLVKPSEKK